MIRDFFLTLLLVVSLEIGFRFLMVHYEFTTVGKQANELATQNLAADVKAIMLNRGGPVAATTVYPILQRNHKEIGEQIAIVPSKVTIDSIQLLLQMKAQGLQPQWSQGKHHEDSVELKAEEFCLQCHMHAEVGDVLGTVTVRTYYSSYMRRWLSEAQFLSVIGMLNIILHTIILYTLLKIRMEPLLSLRATVSSLAKGQIDLHQHAQVKSDDEFGELALDLNTFLDRVASVVHELNDFLGRVTSTNEDLRGHLSSLGVRFNATGDKLRQVMGRVLAHISALAAETGNRDAIGDGVSDAPVTASLEHQIHVVDRVLQQYNSLGPGLIEIETELGNIERLLRRVDVIEEKMQGVTRAGALLLQRFA